MAAIAINGSTLAKHVGHSTEIKCDELENISLYCTSCEVDIYATNLAQEREYRRVKGSEYLARMRVEEPDRYRELNREKGRKRRAHMKADPVLYARYLEKAKEYNATASAKRKAKVK